MFTWWLLVHKLGIFPQWPAQVREKNGELIIQNTVILEHSADINSIYMGSLTRKEKPRKHFPVKVHLMLNSDGLAPSNLKSSSAFTALFFIQD